MTQDHKTAHSVRSSQEKAIAGGADHIGDIVMWDADRLRIRRADLRDIFEAHGQTGFVPSELEPSTALARAAAKPISKELLVKPFAAPKKDTSYAIGIYLREARGERGDAYTCGARVRVEASGSVSTLPPDAGDYLDPCREAAEKIAGAAQELISFAETTDVTAAAVHVLTGPFAGVAMRRRGGAYFIRPEHSKAWQALAQGLAAHGFRDLSYPMAGDNRSRQAAAHMVKASLEGELADLRAQLSGLDDKTRDSTRSHRVEDCEAIASKADLYREILGQWVDELRVGVDRMKKAFVDKNAQIGEDLFAPIQGSDE